MKTTEKFEKTPIDKLIPYARNARTHSKEQIIQLRSSLREFGFVNPVLVDHNYNIIAGHGRVIAAKAEGMTEIPCVFVEHLTDNQKRAYIIADNKLALNADWDTDMLALELADLSDLEFDIEITGFDTNELEKLFAKMENDTQEDNFDLEASLKEAAFVVHGDIWTLGKHRLMCGDATKLKDVERLMDGKKANLLLTDPPYGVDYQGKAGKIINDELKETALVQKLLLPALKNAETVMTNDASAYIFHSDIQGEWVRGAFREAGFKLSGVCQWIKNNISLGRSPYQWKNEPILFGWKTKGKHKWMAGRDQTTIWEYNKPQKSELHPTMKPLELLAKPIKNSTTTNAIVLDLFAGSFSTAMVCEQLDRTCYAMELDTTYATAAIRRYVEQYEEGNVSVERDGQRIMFGDVVGDGGG